MIKIKSFMAFQGADRALANMRALTESEITEELSTFLETVMNKTKKSKFYLAVIDKQLATAITEKFSIPIKVSDAIFEMFRGIRLHFTKFLKNKSKHLGLYFDFLHKVSHPFLQSLSLS